MPAAFLAGRVSGSGAVVSDVQLAEETHKGEMSVADIRAEGKYEAAEQLARTRMAGSDLSSKERTMR